MFYLSIIEKSIVVKSVCYFENISKQKYCHFDAKFYFIFPYAFGWIVLRLWIYAHLIKRVSWGFEFSSYVWLQSSVNLRPVKYVKFKENWHELSKDISILVSSYYPKNVALERKIGSIAYSSSSDYKSRVIFSPSVFTYGYNKYSFSATSAAL